MDIVLYHNHSNTNNISKALTELVTLTGSLREESSIIDPVITVANIEQYMTDINYAYIPEFGRYYFITNIVCVRTNLWRLYFHVDVLYTYGSYIRGNSAIIERNEISYDLKLNDGLFKTQQNPRIAQFSFPSGFTNWNFVLAVAGN